MAIKSLAQSSVRQAPPVNSMLAGYQPNAFHHLETVRLGGTAASIEFTNLARYSDYQHLQIRYVARSNYGDIFDAFIYRFNNDSGNNYTLHWLQGNGSSVTSSAITPYGSIRDFAGVGATATANSYGAAIADILDPFDATKNTTVRVMSGKVGSENQATLASGVWLNTAAITSITIDQIFGTSFVSGSRFSLYGIKARA